ncbi:raffinose/stachyose/melibiose transport system permease protein [Anaerocolumna jejuensis DSM 15929]|uniref:Raffinose/stachyose/melibiose transport system permease protein n=1 Tax=Anaerocolumna jejuensis DSM 15929 TaxID=1121322 RepID=A0A1M6TIU0_9FIRM|nr:sugar ABC transporter permease [Anaerocolumna jejuensis]SHK56847.1 raffinose/stachyose/melibiose transport system permease protein [Anaerocolumna jejuensis DSM 15929]
MNTREIRSKGQYIIIYTLILIPFLYFLYILIVPLGTSIYYSLTRWKGVGDPKFLGLDNYVTLIHDKNFWLVTKNTFLLSIMCVIGQVGIALLIAFLMTIRRLRFKAFHRAVIFFPVVMAPVVVGYVWRFIYNSNYGLLNTFLTSIGKASWIKSWLDDSSIVLRSVAVPVIWQYIGLYMVLLMSAISAVPQEVYECAEIDGATGVKKSLYITLPLIWDTFKICIILCASGTMKIYDHLVALTNGGPGKASSSLALYCYDYTFKFGNFGVGAAIAVSILIFAVGISLVIQLIMGRKSV